ncbi:MAG: class I SAM-dependent methyltransferase [Ignavibacteria bacterium]|nr:class I SAM-dependent methyltransferase [Ignavibacteria bacterium]
MTAKEHYDRHLADFYEWMSGDFDTQQAVQQEFFELHSIFPHENKTAIDLGAGHGLQSISLAKLGFDVIAFDFSKKLISDLNDRSKGYSIRAIESDIADFYKYAERAGLIICMGDTISHLDTFESLCKLIEACYEKLEEKGRLVLSFRDYGIELTDTQRFIPVKSDDRRILTCFLEYFERQVRVTDLLYEKDLSSNNWIQKVSSYMKLRVTHSNVSEIIKSAGFKVLSDENINRMVYIVAEK